MVSRIILESPTVGFEKRRDCRYIRSKQFTKTGVCGREENTDKERDLVIKKWSLNT